MAWIDAFFDAHSDNHIKSFPMNKKPKIEWTLKIQLEIL